MTWRHLMLPALEYRVADGMLARSQVVLGYCLGLQPGEHEGAAERPSKTF